MTFARSIADILQQNPESAFSAEQQDKLYALGYQFYNQCRYSDATGCFTKLTFCNPLMQPYWCGLASSHQMQRGYWEALHAWSVAALLEEKDPLPHFHAAECYFSLNECEDALKALHAAEALLTQSSEDQVLLNKIHSLKEVYHGRDFCR